MAYVSRPVRRMRDDPLEGERAELVVDVAGADDADGAAVDDVAERLARVGTVTERLRFGAIRVTVPEKRVKRVCALDGIAAIETAATRSVEAGDAGEDLDPVR